MSGSPEIVQAIPIPAPNSARGRGAEPGGRRSASAISKVAWIPQHEIGQAEWLSTGRRLGTIGRCSQWWIGDWIRYGNARWGEKYAEAARVTGYDVASLRNMAWVAAQFDLSLRSDKLSWSHHVLLAPLSPDEQERWIERAEGERLSVADLRLELRANGYGRGDEKPPADAEEGRGRGAQVCPHCGHKLSDTSG